MELIQKREAWNKGKLVGQKPPLKPKDIWAIRIHLQNTHAVRDLAMFNLAIDSKLRGCDLVSLHVRDVIHGTQILPRAMAVQRKTQRPVQFELTDPTRSAVAAWIEKGPPEGRSVPLPESTNKLATYLGAPICTDRASLGRSSRAGPISLRHALDAANQGDLDLQADEESASRSATPWAYQAGEYGPVPWHRGGRRSRDFGAD